VQGSLRRTFSPRRLRPLIEPLFASFILGAILWFIFRHRAELEALRHLRLVAPWWLGLSLLAQVTVLVLIARQLQILAASFGYRLTIPRLLRADLHRVAISTATPAGAAVGAGVFARDLEREGVPLEIGLTITLVYGILGFCSFALLLPFSLVTLRTVFPAHLSLLFGRLLAVALGGIALALIALYFAVKKYRQRLIRIIGIVKRVGLRRLVHLLLLALSVDLLNVAIMYAALAALGKPLPIREVLAAYQAGYSLAFLVPFAQGSGPVELASVAVFRALGVSSPVAVAAVLLWRAHELWLPFSLGSLLWLRQEPLIRRAVDRLPALFLFWSGWITIFGLLEQHRHRVLLRGLERSGLLEPWELSRHLELLLGFVSILVSFQLWRYKRTGWLAALILIMLTVVQQLLGRKDPVALILALLAGALLLARWKDFRVRSDVPTLFRGIALSGAGLAVATLYGTAGLVFLSHHALTPGPLTWQESLRILVQSGFGFAGWQVTPVSRYGAWFLDSVPLLIATALLHAAWSLGRPVIWRSVGHERERHRARAIVERCGNSSLDYFKWWPDKVFFFSAHDEGVVSYRVVGRVALVLGDPNACDQDAFERLLDAFLDFCTLNDWEPAFHQVTERFLESYRTRQLRWLKIGEEAIVELRDWSLEKPGFKDLRYLVRRFERDGYVFAVVEPPLDERLLDELESVSREWLTVPGRRERFFTQGQFSRSYVRMNPVALLRHPERGVVAFANLIPSGVPGEATIDLMRRRREPYGAMDVLFVRLFDWCRARGYERFSLGLAPLAGVELPGLASDAVRRRFYELLDAFFSIEGLRHYKAKFQPRWEPRYLVYRTPVALPAIGLALLRATSAPPGREKTWVPSEVPAS